MAATSIWPAAVRRLPWRLGALLLACATAPAEPTEEARQTETSRLTARYDAARARFQSASTNIEAGWRLGEACFNLAEFATNSTQRAALAEEGIAACRRALERAPTNGAAHYFLGACLGELAGTRTLGALKLVSEMEQELLRAIELDPGVDFAGPHRLLGLLYQKAPGWPASVGSRRKARFHLQRAATLAPDYTDNLLCLLEAYLAWGETETARQFLPQVESSLGRARLKFTGPDWAWTWLDWDERWQKDRDAVLQKAKPPSLKAH